MEDAETLSQLRQFFVALGMHGDKTMSAYELPGPVAEHAQQKFVEARQAEHDATGKVQTDDFAFHRYLTIARYMMIGKNGSMELTNDCYDEAKQLEITREERVKALP